MPCVNGGSHDGTADDFGCRVKHFTVNPYAMPSRLNPSKAPRQPRNPLLDQVPTDERGMPFLGKDLKPIGIKKYNENRHRIEELRRKNTQLSTESRNN